MFFASGWGSQVIFIVPELDLILVATGNNEYLLQTRSGEMALSCSKDGSISLNYLTEGVSTWSRQRISVAGQFLSSMTERLRCRGS